MKILQICKKLKLRTSCGITFLKFVFSVTIIPPLKTNIIFFKNKDIILNIKYLSQVRRETEFSPQTGKPNKTASKTALDYRRRFINKDVLSMKIITAAKQNTAQDLELLSEVCQQTLMKETVQQRGQGWWRPRPFPPWMSPSTCPSPHSSSMTCSSVSPTGRVQRVCLIIRDDVSASSAPMCHQSGGRERGTTAEKQGD